MRKIELWRPVKGYEGFYEVSNTNKIRSISRTVVYMKQGKPVARQYKGRELKPELSKDGYSLVILCKNGKPKAFYLHTIVALAFPEICGEWFEGATVNHKDWNRSNNVPENIEWVPLSYNCRYHKPSPFKPIISRKIPLVVENIESGEKKYFLHRSDCIDYLGMKSTCNLLYYLKTGSLYKKLFLIQLLDEKDERFNDLKVLNSPTQEQVDFYGYTS